MNRCLLVTLVPSSVWKVQPEEGWEVFWPTTIISLKASLQQCRLFQCSCPEGAGMPYCAPQINSDFCLIFIYQYPWFIAIESDMSACDQQTDFFQCRSVHVFVWVGQFLSAGNQQQSVGMVVTADRVLRFLYLGCASVKQLGEIVLNLTNFVSDTFGYRVYILFFCCCYLFELRGLTLF